MNAPRQALDRAIAAALARGEPAIVEVTAAGIRAAVKASGMRGGDVYSIAGPHNRQRRQALYSVLMGRRCTVAESGITNIMEALWRLARIPEGCLSNRENALTEWLKETT